MIADEKRSTPMFMQLAGNQRSLLDGFSVIAALNQDLKGATYDPPPPREEEEEPVPKPKKPKQARTSSTTRSANARKTLTDYAKGNYTDEDLIRGFDDGEGGVRFAIGSIVEYHPKKGVLVHWKGWGEEDRTWESLENIPEDWNEDIKEARNKFEAQNNSRKKNK